MPVPVICSCTAKLRVGDHLRGKQIQCPKCGYVHAISKTGAVSAGKAGNPAPAKAEIPDFDDVLDASGFSDAEKDRLEDTLEKGEQLLWAGKARAMIPFYFGWAMSAGGYFLAVVLSVGAFFGMGFGEVQWGMMGVAGVVVIAATLWPFFSKWRHGKFAYALTTQRALSWDANLLGVERFQEYVAADLARVTRQKWGKSGVGSLIFASEVRRKDQRVVRIHGFLYIEDAARVEKLIREHLVDRYTDALYE